MTQKQRPLSPHLQIYKPQMTSVLSILHRMTGVGLILGLVVFVAWLVALATGIGAYADFMAVATTTPGKILLFAWAWALCYHLCTGVRHLVWDTGKALEIKSAYRAGYAVLLVSTLLTVLVCYGASSGM